jgi:hypothetical protein
MIDEVVGFNLPNDGSYAFLRISYTSLIYKTIISRVRSSNLRLGTTTRLSFYQRRVSEG